MLVLTRKIGEEIVIGDNIVVQVVEIRGDKVRIGVTAPNSIPVHRREVFDAIKRNNGQDAAMRPGYSVQNQGKPNG